MEKRIEQDSLGTIEVPADALWGASTQRAVENFPMGGRRFPRSFLGMLGELKRAAAETNKKLGSLDNRFADAIILASEKVASGTYDDHFPLDVFQTGSGTSTNMNANEVIANLANISLGGAVGTKAPVHPNDHVNYGQSSNDVIPSVIHMAAAFEIKTTLLPALRRLEEVLDHKSKTFSQTIKIGRTHLMDATPLTLGQEFSGYAAQVRQSVAHLETALPSLYRLAIGGTAVGTGINTHPKFASTVCKILSKRLELPFEETTNHFAEQGAKDACVEASGALKRTAVALFKIADDIRWLGSGPRAGLAELKLPTLQPGSSIMPGKVNPVLPEVVCQVAADVIGNDATVTVAALTSKFELNTMMPLLAVKLLDSIALLSRATHLFAEKCVAGIEVDAARCAKLVETNLMLATALAPLIGYDRAAAIAKRAYTEDRTIREVALEEKVLDARQLDEVLNVSKMIKPQS